MHLGQCGFGVMQMKMLFSVCLILFSQATEAEWDGRGYHSDGTGGGLTVLLLGALHSLPMIVMAMLTASKAFVVLTAAAMVVVAIAFGGNTYALIDLIFVGIGTYAAFVLHLDSRTSATAMHLPTEAPPAPKLSSESSASDFGATAIWIAVAVVCYGLYYWYSSSVRQANEHYPAHYSSSTYNQPRVAPPYSVDRPSTEHLTPPQVDPEQARFDEVVARVERMYPQLDRSSPLYREVLVEAVIDRMNVITARGTPRSYALEMAVAEMEREEAPNRQKQIAGEGAYQPKTNSEKVDQGSQKERTPKLAKSLKPAVETSQPLDSLSNTAKEAVPTITKPLNSHWKFVGSRQTNVWMCDIGYKQINDQCEALPSLPQNAVYVAVGSNAWNCKAGYYLLQDRCISNGTR